MAMEATYYRDKGMPIYWGVCNRAEVRVRGLPSGVPFLDLPRPDRIWTQAFDPKYQDNGNFKYRPGTYIQAASGCIHGKCTFCVENGKPYEVRPVGAVIDELVECKALGFKEVFDDSATFPNGSWLDRFLDRCIKQTRGLYLGCNSRMVDMDYPKMKAAGFRMILFGVESANQGTLDKINKGVKVEDLKYVIAASLAGLEPHVAVMFGYPWESDSDAIRTLKLVWGLLREGYAKTAQASFYSPDGGGGKESQRKYVKAIYDVSRSPSFWLTKIRDIHNVDDLKYLWRQIKAGIGGSR